MALPKLQTPIFTTRLPSNNKEIKYRPFLVKEEKILLIAKESNEPKHMITAFKQLINNCVLNEDFVVEDIPLFDLEYIFLLIRAKSQNNIAHIVLIDDEDKNEYTATIDFNEIIVTKDESHKNVIDLDGNVGVRMKYPTFTDLEKIGMFDSANISSSQMVKLIQTCIEAVFDNDSVYPMADASEQEKEEFFESLSNAYLEKIKHFFETFPTISVNAVYKKNGKQVTKVIRGTANFLQ